jgi:hypothetical protein
MIDNVTIKTSVKLNTSLLELKNFKTEIKNNSITKYLIWIENVCITYYPYQYEISMYGRLFNLFDKCNVKLIDTAFVGQDNQDIFTLIGRWNQLLLDYCGMDTNILDWKLTRIECTFDIHLSDTRLIEVYLKTLNNAPLKSSAKKLNLDGSFYVKCKSDWKLNENNKTRNGNYAINFYHKKVQLLKLQQEDLSKTRKDRKINNNDIEYAEDILRLEIKAFSGLLKRYYAYLQKEYKSNKSYENRTLKDFIFNPIDCYNLISYLYCDILQLQHNYKSCTVQTPYLNYFSAKGLDMALQNNINMDADDSKHEEFRNYIFAIQNGHCITKKQKESFEPKLHSIGINTKFLIPDELEINYLKSPMSLIQEQISETIEKRLQYQEAKKLRLDSQFNLFPFVDLRKNKDTRLKKLNMEDLTPFYGTFEKI